MPRGAMREMMETYKPHILTRRRQLLEDCVRDLRLNNDHIHIVEQEMRQAIKVSFSAIWYSTKKLRDTPIAALHFNMLSQGTTVKVGDPKSSLPKVSPWVEGSPSPLWPTGV